MFDAIKMLPTARCPIPTNPKIRKETELSVDNADSTLQIVKEQQPTFYGLRLTNQNNRLASWLADTLVCQPGTQE